jgi:hypothetical protein
LTGMPASGTLADMNQPARLRSSPNGENMLSQMTRVGAVAESAMLSVVSAGAQSKFCQPAADWLIQLMRRGAGQTGIRVK